MKKVNKKINYTFDNYMQELRDCMIEYYPVVGMQTIDELQEYEELFQHTFNNRGRISLRTAISIAFRYPINPLLLLEKPKFTTFGTWV